MKTARCYQHQAAQTKAEHQAGILMTFYGYNLYRSFDSEGKPFKIYDDDLDEVFSKSDYANGKRPGHA